MTKREVFNGKPYAGNPYVRFDEGEVASATPRLGSLLCKKVMMLLLCFYVWCVHAYTEKYQQGGGNDTMSQAENVGYVGSSAVTINGVCNTRWSSGDIDWYSFVPSGGILSWSVRVFNASMGHGVPIVLYSSSGRIVKIFSVSYDFEYGSDFTNSGSVAINPGERYYLLCGDESLNQNYEGGQSLSYRITLSTNGGNPSPSSPTYTKPDLQPYTPSDWASSMVLNTSSSTRSTTKTSFKDTDTIYVSFSFACYNKNISSLFYTTLYVDGVAQQTWHTDGLNAQKAAYVNYYKLKSLAPGSHTIKLVIDSKDTISESNENNNSISRTITISETVKRYSVNFNKNDGSGLTSSRSFASGQSQQLPWIGSGFKWSRSGYDFLGWSTYSGATTATYSNGAWIYNLASAGGSTTLYAVWKKKGYTVRFNKNDGSGLSTSRSFASGQSQQLPWIGSGFKWSRSGYDFVGWSTYSGATTAMYSNGAWIYNLASAGGSTTLYAVWKTKGYTIRFNKNDGSGVTSSRNFASGQSQQLPWIGSGLKWTRSGYDFLGWSTSSSATSAKYANGAQIYNLVSAGSSTTLYAVWVPANTYLVRFHGFLPPGKTGTGPIATRRYVAGVKYRLPWINGELGWNPGYEFLGWARGYVSSSIKYQNGETVSLSSVAGVEIDLYSTWKDYDWNDYDDYWSDHSAMLSCCMTADSHKSHTEETNEVISGVMADGGVFQLSLSDTGAGEIFIYDTFSPVMAACDAIRTGPGLLVTFEESVLLVVEDGGTAFATWVQ